MEIETVAVEFGPETEVIDVALIGARKVLLSGRGFLPTDLAGLNLWLKSEGPMWQNAARTTPAIADSDPVGAWDDMSGSSNHVTQSTDANRPLLKLAIVNGKRVVRFSDPGAPLSINFADVAQANTVFAVYDTGRPWETGGSRQIFNSDGGVGNPFNIHAGAALAGPAGTQTAGTFVIHAGVFNSNSSRCILNGVATTGDAGTNGQAALDMFFDGVTRFAGDCAELISYTRLLDNADLNKVGIYLAKKYGLTWAGL